MKIDIVSGFLGAGKTTFIKRLLQTKIINEKVVLIENEFGEVSIDGALLGDSKIEVTELSQGCICCSLAGDFSKSLNEVIARFQPERILIEPSGVGKLSDVKKAVVDANLGEYLNSSVCIVDAVRCKMYAKNFGEFFIDQIKNASVVILSRVDLCSEEKITEAYNIVREYNAEATIITTPISLLSDENLFNSFEGVKDDFLNDLIKEASEEHHHHHHHHHDEDECDDPNCCCHHHHHDEDDDDDDDEDECCCGHHHHHHDEEECDDPNCSCHHHHHDDDDDDDEEEEHHCCHHDHDEHEHHHHHHHGHDADEVFQSVGIESVKVYNTTELDKVLNALANTFDYGIIVRAKGIIKTEKGWKVFNLSPNEYTIEDANPIEIGKICVIGSKLAEEQIKLLF